MVVNARVYATRKNGAGEDQIFHNRATLHWGECVDFPLSHVNLYDSTGKFIDVWYKP